MEIDPPALPTSPSGLVTSNKCFTATGSNTFTWYILDEQTSPDWKVSSYQHTYAAFNYVFLDGEFYLTGWTTRQNQHTGIFRQTSEACIDKVIYKPEYKDFIFPFCALISFIFILGLVYKIIIKRLLP